MGVALKLPAFVLMVWTMYWSLPLANLTGFITAWKLWGVRNDTFEWWGDRAWPATPLPPPLLRRASELHSSRAPAALQVPLPGAVSGHPLSQVRQHQAVQRRAVHVPGESAAHAHQLLRTSGQPRRRCTRPAAAQPCVLLLLLLPVQSNHRSWADFFVDAYLTEGRGQLMSRCGGRRAQPAACSGLADLPPAARAG